MKLEVWKYYRTRGWEKVGPMIFDHEVSDFSDYVWMGPGDIRGRYSKDGIDGDMPLGFYPSDLVSEWTEQKEIGTLTEIGAKVGDVVEWLGTKGRTRDYVTYEVINITDGEYFHKSDNHEHKLCKDELWRMVYRSTSHPVRKVTRKEIVPGVYGSIHVDVNKDGSVFLSMEDEFEHDADDIFALITTLTAIRDAMLENEK